MVGYSMGETGRSAAKLGGVGGSANSFAMSMDQFTKTSIPTKNVKPYTMPPVYKMMGSVELIAHDR